MNRSQKHVIYSHLGGSRGWGSHARRYESTVGHQDAAPGPGHRHIPVFKECT